MMDLRTWWWDQQGLGGRLHGQTAAEVLAVSGWARSVGGSGPYLGFHARSGAGRKAIDGAVAELAIHELPSARGCTYVVPASDFALALKVAQGFADGDMATARKLGVTDEEVDRLAQTVIEALRDRPLDPEEIKTAVGGAVRNLGEAGRRRGITTTLPLALGRLQVAGEIRRLSTNGRLDHQRYRYAVWQPNPLRGFRLSTPEAFTELARRYFDWTAPATLAEFQWFSGLGVKAATTAVKPLDLEPLKPGSERLIKPEFRTQLSRLRPAPKPQYALIGSVDAMLLLRRNLRTLMDEAVDQQVCPDGGLMELPSHAILDRGRVVGLWEYDPETESIAWMSFSKPDDALRAAIAQTEAWVRKDLGDARSFSLDSPKSRAPRIAALRQGLVPR